jgi:hypothetical protein
LSGAARRKQRVASAKHHDGKVLNLVARPVGRGRRSLRKGPSITASQLRQRAEAVPHALRPIDRLIEPIVRQLSGALAGWLYNPI